MSFRINKYSKQNLTQEKTLLAAHNLSVGARVGLKYIEVTKVKIGDEKFYQLKKVSFFKRVAIFAKGLFCKKSSTDEKRARAEKILKGSFKMVEKEVLIDYSLHRRNPFDSVNDKVETVAGAVQNWSSFIEKNRLKKNGAFSPDFMEKTRFQSAVAAEYKSLYKVGILWPENLKKVDLKKKDFEKALHPVILEPTQWVAYAKSHKGVLLTPKEFGDAYLEAICKEPKEVRIKIWSSLKPHIFQLIVKSYVLVQTIEKPDVNQKEDPRAKTYHQEALEYAFKLSLPKDPLWYSNEVRDSLLYMSLDLKREIYPKLGKKNVERLFYEAISPYSYPTGPDDTIPVKIAIEILQVAKDHPKLLEEIKKKTITFDEFYKRLSDEQKEEVAAIMG